MNKPDTPMQLLFKSEGKNNYSDATISMSLIIEKMKFVEFSVLTDGMTIAQRQQFFDDYYAKWNDLNA